jgi:hypothetical protein
VWRTSLLVDLNGGLVGIDSNDFSDEVLVANTDLSLSASRLRKSLQVTYKLVHGNTDHVLGHDDGTVAVSM